jgi:hypothetical protein
MSFTSLDFTSMGSNAYIVYNVDTGFKLLTEVLDGPVAYLSDGAAVSLGNCYMQGPVLTTLTGSFSTLSSRDRPIVKVGSSWAVVTQFLDNSNVVLDRTFDKGRLCTILSGTVTTVNNYTAGTAITFESTGVLPTNITAGQIYYVLTATTQTFTFSATVGGSAITTSGGSGLHSVYRVFSAITPSYAPDTIKDTIIATVTKTGTSPNFVYNIDPYYSVNNESTTIITTVTALPVSGEYVGQLVLFTNLIYTWNGTSWVTSYGEDGATVTLTTSSQAFTYTTSGTTPTPASATITANVLNVTNPQYRFLLNGSEVQAWGITPNYPYTPQANFTNMPDLIKVEVREGTGSVIASDILSTFGVKPGENGDDAVTVIMTNEAHTLARDGASVDYSNSGTSFIVYIGTTVCAFGASGAYTYSVSATNNNIVAATPTSGVYGNASGLATGVLSATITFTITIRGPDAQIYATVTKVQSFSVSEAGRDVQVSTGATAPSSPSTGDIWYNGDVAFYYNGTVWVQIVNAPTGTRSLSSLSDEGIYTGEIAYYSGDYYIWDGALWLLAIDGITLALSNQTHTLPASSAGVPSTYVGASTRVYVYSSGTDDTANWTLSASTTNVTGSFGSGANSNLYTVTNLSQPAGFVDITATKGSRTKTARFSLSTSNAGTNGVAIRLRGNVLAVKQNNSGGRSPGTIIFKAENVSSSGVTTYTGDIKIESGTNGTVFGTNHGTVNGTESSLDITGSSNTFFRGILYVTGTSTIIDEQVISVISDGLDGNSGGTVSRLDLSNDSHSIPATSDGTVLSYDGADTELRIYKGQALDTGWTFSEISETNVLGSFPGSSSTSTANPAVWTVSSWNGTADVAYVDFQATKTGEATQYATFSLTRVRGGANGSSPTVYKLVLSRNSVIKNPSGVFTPASLTFSAVSITGNNLPVSYAGTIKYQIDTGSGFGSEITGTSYTPSGNVRDIKVNLYDGTTLLDSETIPVIVDGPPGINTATISLYNKNTSAVTPPAAFTGTATYTFATSAVTGLTLNGWSTSVPAIANGEYLWVRQAVASSNVATDDIAIGEWSGAVVLSNGGIDGLNTTPLFLYNKNTSAVTPPTAFTGTATYTFATDSLTNLTLNGWTRTAPSLIAGEYLWVRQAVASSNTATDTIAIGEWSAAVVAGVAGTNGPAGLNNTTISLYNKNTSAVTPPTAFTGTATYTFATSAVTGLTLNGWSTSVPAITNGEYLWVRQAVASSNTATDTIAIGEWSGAVVLSNGGIDGLNTTPLFLYNKNTSAVTPPTAFTGTATYTFATDSLTGLTLNSWARTAPSLSAGEYLWVRQAVASSNTATDTIAIGEWSVAAVAGVAGTNGPAGLNNATINLYNKNTSAVTPPAAFTGTATYTFATATITGLTLNGWSTSVPAITNGEYLWVRQATASSSTATDDIAIGEWSGAIVLSVGGTNGTSAVSGYLTNESQALFAYANGTITSYTPATGSFVIVSGTTDISASFTLSTLSNPQNLTVAYVNRTYTVSAGFDANEDTASLTIRATGSGAYAGITIDKVFSLSKTRGGYEIVATLPAGGDPRNFAGSIVFLTTDNKLYRYNGTAWVATVPAGDITGQLIAAQIASLAASQVTGQLTDAQLAGIAAAKLTGTIANTQIADGAISTAKIAAGAVTAASIAADTITAANIAAGAITASELAAGSVTAASIAAGTITATQIAADTITANQIAANAITATELNANAVTADKINAGAVTAGKISVTELSAISANMGTVTAGLIRSGTGGDRTEITPQRIEVYAGGTLRVRLGIW